MLEAEAIDGLVLRYGFFYGPGHLLRRRWLAGRRGAPAPLSDRRPRRGRVLVRARRRRCGGDRRRLRARRPGIYNVTDDEPAPLREWLPAYAEALGAKRPLRVPKLVARLVAGGRRSRFATDDARRLQREGEARARLAAGVLAAGAQGFRAGARITSRDATPHRRKRWLTKFRIFPTTTTRSSRTSTRRRCASTTTSTTRPTSTRRTPRSRARSGPTRTSTRCSRTSTRCPPTSRARCATTPAATPTTASSGRS